MSQGEAVRRIREIESRLSMLEVTLGTTRAGVVQLAQNTELFQQAGFNDGSSGVPTGCGSLPLVLSGTPDVGHTIFPLNWDDATQNWAGYFAVNDQSAIGGVAVFQAGCTNFNVGGTSYIVVQLDPYAGGGNSFAVTFQALICDALRPDFHQGGFLAQNAPPANVFGPDVFGPNTVTQTVGPLSLICSPFALRAATAFTSGGVAIIGGLFIVDISG